MRNHKNNPGAKDKNPPAKDKQKENKKSSPKKSEINLRKYRKRQTPMKDGATLAKEVNHESESRVELSTKAKKTNRVDLEQEPLKKSTAQKKTKKEPQSAKLKEKKRAGKLAP